MTSFRTSVVRLAAVVCICLVPFVARAQDENLTKEQKVDFLLHAKVVKYKQSDKGVTAPQKLTLSDGKITHDASFQAIDEHKMSAQMSGGGTEMNFVDSWKYNVAAYYLAELLGIDDLMPVTVERKWQGNSGSLTWWLPVVMDEQDRMKRKISPPDIEAWNKQVWKVRVLNQLIYDADANQTNLLVGKNWELWRVDYSRGFRMRKELQDPNSIQHCQRDLLEKLKKLDRNELQAKTNKYLTKNEIDGVMARRDLLVAHFEKLVAAKGENEVLY